MGYIFLSSLIWSTECCPSWAALVLSSITPHSSNPFVLFNYFPWGNCSNQHYHFLVWKIHCHFCISGRTTTCVLHMSWRKWSKVFFFLRIENDLRLETKMETRWIYSVDHHFVTTGGARNRIGRWRTGRAVALYETIRTRKMRGVLQMRYQPEKDVTGHDLSYIPVTRHRVVDRVDHQTPITINT